MSTVTGQTRTLGLIADPVVQARSPAMVNARLASLDLQAHWELLPMQVKAEQLPAFIQGLRAWDNFDGAIVSMPHKAMAATLVDKLTPEAQLVGAVNVIKRHPDGQLEGTALDGHGMVAGLRQHGHDISGQSCLLVGAGGAASAIALALAQGGCRLLTILNRHASKAADLAQRVQQACPSCAIELVDAPGQHYDIAINGTSLGMQAGDALPMSNDQILRSSLIAECVIAPEMTALLQRAQALGRPVHTGVPMLQAQIDLILAFLGIPLSGQPLNP